MNKHSKYRPLMDDIKVQIMRAEIGVTCLYKIMLETLDEVEKHLAPQWVSVEGAGYPTEDDGPYWVLFPCGSIKLMRFNPYKMYGGKCDFWQDYSGNDRFMNHTKYIKMEKPNPPEVL